MNTGGRGGGRRSRRAPSYVYGIGAESLRARRFLQRSPASVHVLENSRLGDHRAVVYAVPDSSQAPIGPTRASRYHQRVGGRRRRSAAKENKEVGDWGEISCVITTLAIYQRCTVCHVQNHASRAVHLVPSLLVHSTSTPRQRYGGVATAICVSVVAATTQSAQRRPNLAVFVPTPPTAQARSSFSDL